MDAIGAFIGIIVMLMGVSFVTSLIGAGARAGGRAIKKAVTGKDTYFGPAQLKFNDEVNEELGWVVKRVMYRGQLPNAKDMSVSFAISAFDVTDGDGKWKPVFSVVDAAQEDDTICYGMDGDFGFVSHGSSMTDWVQLGAVIPELLQPPFSGQRTIQLVVRFFDTAKPLNIVAGASDGDGELLSIETISFTHHFDDKGYEEASKDKEEAQAISLKVGVAVAMADGSLDDLEGVVLKNWIIREVAGYSDSKQSKLKSLFNEALKEGFNDAKTGQLSLSRLTERLSEIGDKKTKYDAIELCLDVMAADGVADPEEMAVIRAVAKTLELDMDEIERMREKVTLNLSAHLTSEKGMESLVGLEADWSDEEKRKHLRTEFQKWSNRLNNLHEGEERDAAQNMLDNIATLRKKYG